MSYNQLNADLPKGDWDMLSDTWSTGPDPTYLLSIQDCSTPLLDNGTGGNIDAFFSDFSYDKLFTQQIGEFSIDAARAATIGSDAVDPVHRERRRHAVLRRQPQGAARSDHLKDFFYGTPNAQGFYPHRS